MQETRARSWLGCALAGAVTEDDHLRDAAIFAAIIALLAFLGPFGTGEDLAPPTRVLYWSLSIGAGYVGNRLYASFLKPTLLRRGARRTATILNAATITLSASAMVFALEAWLRRPIPLFYAVVVLGNVAVIALAVIGVFALAQRPTSNGPSPAYLAFRDRWPASLRSARLLALSSEDHFVRVHTDAGETLLAGRFADALAAVADESGCQVHRGWWIAGAAPERLDRRGGKWTLRVGELAIPVSRRFRPDVRARGWDRLSR